MTTAVGMAPVKPGPGLGTRFTADATREVNGDIILTGHAKVQFTPKDQQLSLTANTITLNGFGSKTRAVALSVALVEDAADEVKTQGKNCVHVMVENATLAFELLESPHRK